MTLSKGEWAKGVVHWRDGKVAYLSVVFTWDLPLARKVAEYYRMIGCRVVAGGPAFTTHLKYLDGIAEVPTKRVMRHGKEVEVPGDLDRSQGEAVVRHNPMATFASRGCSENCSFCIVPRLEGGLATISTFTPRPVLCDNNLSALPAAYQDHIVARYKSAGVPLLDANSGFEPKTFDNEVFARWRPILKGPWRFGFDEMTEGEAVRRVCDMLRGVSSRAKQVYVMIGREPFEVCMDRIKKVIAWGAEPYVQPFIPLNSLKRKPKVAFDWTEQKLADVARWVNGHVWRGTPNFADYDRTIDYRRLAGRINRRLANDPSWAGARRRDEAFERVRQQSQPPVTK